MKYLVYLPKIYFTASKRKIPLVFSFFRMVDLIKPEDGTKYVDLILGYEGDKDDEEELPSPPVRYFF